MLVVEVPQRPAYLVVTFPVQTIAESAYFEASIVKPAGDPNRPDADKNTSVSEPPDPPGQAKAPRKTSAQLGHPSRLVFIVPAEMRVPFSTAGLLDWSALELSVNPIAAIGADPAQKQIDAAPAIQPPSQTETALEMPYRLVISPNAQVKWNHRDRAFTSQGRTELWHTWMQLKTATGAIEPSPDHRAPLRAIWSPHYSPTQRPDPFTKDPDLQRTAMSGDDRYQIVVLTSAFHGYEADIVLSLATTIDPVVNPVLAAQPANARDQEIAAVPDVLPQVSGFELRVNPALRNRFKFTTAYVPEPFEFEQLMLSPLGGWLKSRGNWNPPRRAKPVRVPPNIDLSDIFTKFKLLDTRPLRLTGGADAIAPLVAAANGNAQAVTEQLDLSEWGHVATQGRDHYVRIVYEGELWPFRHRAALIKVTERKFKENGASFVVAEASRSLISSAPDRPAQYLLP